VRLGRRTDTDVLADGTPVPVGQKLWFVDDDEVPILELRELVITPAS
jgi:protein involved in temperature-dependent protein secretion